MIRYNIVLGDTTTSGGFVIEASLHGKNMGRQLAGEGNLCTCPKCGSTGRILCVGPRQNVMFDGVRDALSGDIVLCKCENKPRLINSLTSMRHVLSPEEMAEYRGQSSAPAPKQQLSGERGAQKNSLLATTSETSTQQDLKENLPHGKRFALVDRTTGRPVSNRRFVAKVNGAAKPGVSDAAGYATIETKAKQTIEMDLTFVSPKKTFKLNVQQVLITASAESDYKNKPAMRVLVDDHAATRESIINEIRHVGVMFKSRSDWHAKPSIKSDGPDWDYTAIALHHAGNSFSCSADGAEEMRAAENIDMKSFNHLSYHYAIDCMGVVYEALDIREKGAHIERGNTGVIGIVFLADFSVRGEAGKYGPGVGAVAKKGGAQKAMGEFLGVLKDDMSFNHDEPTDPQIKAAYALVKTLDAYFRIAKLGGHREFAKLQGTSRSCPGVYGMELAALMRKDFKFLEP